MNAEEDAIWGYRSVGKRRRLANATEAGNMPPRAHAGGDKSARRGSRVKGAKSQRHSERVPIDHSPRGVRAASVQEMSSPASNANKSSPPQDAGRPLSQVEFPNASEGKQMPKEARPVHDGYCPICQMPFSLLLIETPRWHVAECLDTPGCTDIECPDGLLCNNTIPIHYKRYSHLLLAESRALGQSVVQSTFLHSSVRDAFTISPDPNNNHQSLQNNQSPWIQEHLTNKNQNALLLLKSPAFKVKEKSSSKFKAASSVKRSTSSENVSRGGVSAAPPGSLHRRLPHSASQLTKEMEPGISTEGFFNVNSTKVKLNSLLEDKSTSGLGSNASNNNKDDISYSPFRCNEIPDQKRLSSTRRRLFHGQTIKHDCKLEDNNCSSSVEVNNHRQELVHKSCGLKDTITIDFNTVAIDLDSSLLTDSATILTKNRIGIATQAHQAKACYGIPLDNEEMKQMRNWSQTNLPESNLIKLESVPLSSDSLLKPLQIKQEPTSLPESTQVKQEPTKSFQLAQSSIVQELHDCLARKEEEDHFGCSAKTALPQYSLILPSLNVVKQHSCHSEALISSKSIGLQKSGTTTLEMASPDFMDRGPIKIPKRRDLNKELKQTDIGVFFGLQPKIKDEPKCPKNIPQGKANELVSELSYNERRQRQRKRKIENSVGDETCIGTVDKPQMELSDAQRGRTKRQRTGVSTHKKAKQCPFYKKIPGTNFTVDAFQYGDIQGCTAYFLTHFHSDHYGGLTKNFKCPIYCSTITSNLVISKLKVQAQYVTSLPMNTECVVDGIKVVLLDANHCPGAVMLLFQLPNGKTLLHTGDFRANTSMERYTHLMGQKIDTLYLDTTYCSPEYTFPSQQETIQFVANVAFETIMMHPRTLIVCGTYSIGKERVFLAIAEVLGCKVCITRNKLEILQCLDSDRINSTITMDWENSQLHLLPMMQVTFKGLQAHMNKFPGKYDQIVAFKPTGWAHSGLGGTMHNIRPRVQGKFTIYGVPYSEHSSYLEMKRFVQWLKPDKIIPTVNNGSWQQRNMMDKIFNEWMTNAEQREVTHP
ncbi:DNA cross-link repair 1A protein isoform X1 [Stegostoma tigrinum]|uniref:DNA cross-link repair 1A protein isoform X1 n=1 Tax=Stegostoma tigrinum TaxID=3053191 RepID=UPI0028708288|nr:DNA cross-link repair 1A protein isoform X1 [Stegostoma tigrinum]